jgi:flavin-dependent dehydrogenase
MTQGSVPLIKQAGSIPAEPVKDLVVDHVMRVGDAAGHATPHMMEGVRPCIESGMLCGMIAAEAYKKGDFSKNLLRKYEKLWQNRHKMQYLYLLSEAEINFSQDDAKIEKSISSQAGKSHRMNPNNYLRGLGGNSRFPFFLLGRPSLQRLRILSRFVRHNVRWSLE